MTRLDAGTYPARARLEVALEALEGALEELERFRITEAELTAPLARAVALLGRYLLATER